MQPDAEGFMQPVVASECIECGKCLRNCPVASPVSTDAPLEGFAAYLQNRDTLRNSSSGGIFVAIAEAILASGGVVFGCAEDLPGEPSHVVIEVRDELARLQGSKYVQSDLSGVFGQVVQYLNRNIPVLFAGTPCQVAGLLHFAGPRKNLYTIDLICHGVPSRKMYQAYLSWLEGVTNAKVKQFVFRSKKKHDWSLTYRVEMEANGKQRVQEKMASLSPYYSHFLKGLDYRESCYCCPFARTERVGDVTLGDFWGIENVLPSFRNTDGISAVLINSVKGRELWNWIQDRVVYESVDVAQIVARNGQLRAPTKRPPERDQIYGVLETQGYAGVVRMYENRKEIIVDSIKDCIPNRIRQKIKQVIHSFR